MVSLKCYIFITISNRSFCYISCGSRLIILFIDLKHFTIRFWIRNLQGHKDRRFYRKKMLVCENMAKIWSPCTSFPEELLDFRDQVFCDLGTTDVCLLKTVTSILPNNIRYGYPIQKWNVRLQNLKSRGHGPGDLFFYSNYQSFGTHRKQNTSPH